MSQSPCGEKRKSNAPYLIQRSVKAFQNLSLEHLPLGCSERLMISGHYFRDEACVSWVVLPASMTPRFPQGTATLYWEVISNGDASCLSGNSAQALLQNKCADECI